MECNAGDDDSREYEVEAIWDRVVYVRESKLDHLLGFYYLVSWKEYIEKKNTWKPASAVQHLRKLINSFHEDHPYNPTSTSSTINITTPMARLTVKPTKYPKQKRGWPANSTNKQVKNWATFDFYHVFGQI